MVKNIVKATNIDIDGKQRKLRNIFPGDCSFPFKYRNKPVYKCQIRKDGEWCATKVDNNMKAIYFSREPIPSNKKYNKVSLGYKQVCIIPFRRNFLFKFNNLKQTKLEKIESVDMLRLIENNIDIKLVKSTLETYSVDTLEDLNKVAKLMKSH